MKSQHHRSAIWNAVQHPYKHTLTDFSYTNPALPGVTNAQTALNYMLAVLYPQTKPAVANAAALPASGNTLNDFRVVNDNGVDGKAAAYRWEQREGDASPKWYKIYDMDWGVDSILTQFHQQSLSVYVLKGGNDDLDSTGAAITGTFAGQTVYGGATANNNLTLYGNSGDGVGSITGFVQVGTHFRPATGSNILDVGTSALKFRTGYFGTSVIVGNTTLSQAGLSDSGGSFSFAANNLSTTGTLASGTITVSSDLTLSTGSVVSTSGALSFGANNLTTTGTLHSGTITVSSDLALATGSITSASGTISFGATNLTTSGTIGGGAITGTTVNGGNLRITGNVLSSTNTNGNITVTPNGTGTIVLSAAVTTAGIANTGAITSTTSTAGGNLQLSGNTLSSTNLNGAINLTPNGVGTVVTSATFLASGDNTLDLGLVGTRFRSVYIGTNFGDGTNTVPIGTVLTLRNILFRDAGHITGLSNGDALFYDSTSGTFLAAQPGADITHSTLTGLTTADAGHTQFALLTGRSGGQTLSGGTAGGENLVLSSTANASKGVIQFKDNLVPTTDAVYSSGWSGTNLGGTSNRLNNIYMKGQLIGGTLENLATGSISFSAQTPGRVYFDSTLGVLKFDTGAAIRTIIDNSSAGSGTVTSVTFTGDGTLLSSTPSTAVTTTGTLAAALLTQAKNTFLAGPTSGSNAAPTFRALTPADLIDTRNLLINGAFDLWQRGTSTTIANAATSFEPDRWKVTNNLGSAGVITYAQATSAQSGSLYDASVKISAAPTAANNASAIFSILQFADNQTSIRAYNGVLSGSIYVKALGNFTSVTVRLIYATTQSSVAPNQLTAGVSYTINSSTYTLCSTPNVSVGTTPTTSGVIGIQVVNNASGVSSGNVSDLNNGFLVTQGMLNLGATVAPFQRAGANQAQEVAMAQRYYEKSYDLTTAPGTSTSVGGYQFVSLNTTTFYASMITFKVTKVAAPTITMYGQTGTSGVWYDNNLSANNGNAGAVLTGLNSFEATCTSTFTAGHAYTDHWTADAEF